MQADRTDKMRARFILLPLIYALLGVAVGAAAGAVVGLFGLGLQFVSGYGSAHFSLMVWFLPAVGILTVAMIRKFGGSAVGMTAAFRASRGEIDRFPLRNAVFQFAGTWSAHLFCASVGREGAAMQIGAAIGDEIGAALPWRGARKTLIVAGMAAGFSALFATPVCALFFALEVTIVGSIRLRALVAAAFASFTAYFVAGLYGLGHFTVAVQFSAAFDLGLLWRLFALGAMCGAAGLLFCLVRKFSALFFGAVMPNPYVRVAVVGALAACLLYLSDGRYSGAGDGLIRAALGGETVRWYDWAVKILFTAVTLSVGFLGGEVTTFFAAGSCLGSVAGAWLGLPPVAAACLGYAAVFGAATNTFIAPVFLCMELFGGSFLLPAAVVCVAAYLFNFGHSVYNQRVREDITVKAVRRMRARRLPVARRLY